MESTDTCFEQVHGHTIYNRPIYSTLFSGKPSDVEEKEVKIDSNGNTIKVHYVDIGDQKYLVNYCSPKLKDAVYLPNGNFSNIPVTCQWDSHTATVLAADYVHLGTWGRFLKTVQNIETIITEAAIFTAVVVFAGYAAPAIIEALVTTGLVAESTATTVAAFLSSAANSSVLQYFGAAMVGASMYAHYKELKECDTNEPLCRDNAMTNLAADSIFAFLTASHISKDDLPSLGSGVKSKGLGNFLSLMDESSIGLFDMERAKLMGTSLLEPEIANIASGEGGWSSVGKDTRIDLLKTFMTTSKEALSSKTFWHLLDFSELEGEWTETSATRLKGLIKLAAKIAEEEQFACNGFALVGTGSCNSSDVRNWLRAYEDNDNRQIFYTWQDGDFHKTMEAAGGWDKENGKQYLWHNQDRSMGPGMYVSTNPVDSADYTTKMTNPKLYEVIVTHKKIGGIEPAPRDTWFSILPLKTEIIFREFTAEGLSQSELDILADEILSLHGRPKADGAVKYLEQKINNGLTPPKILTEREKFLAAMANLKLNLP